MRKADSQSRCTNDDSHSRCASALWIGFMHRRYGSALRISSTHLLYAPALRIGFTQRIYASALRIGLTNRLYKPGLPNAQCARTSLLTCVIQNPDRHYKILAFFKSKTTGGWDCEFPNQCEKP